MEFSWAYALLNALSAFVGAGLSFRGLAMPMFVKLKAQKEFLKEEISFLKKELALLKEDYYNFKSEVITDFHEMARNDSNISKRMDLLELRINENTALLKSIDNHFKQTLDLLTTNLHKKDE